MVFALLPLAGTSAFGESEPPDRLLRYGMEILLADPVRGVIYLADSQGDAVRIYDAATGELVGSIAVGSSPQTLALARDGASLYATIVPANEIVVVDLASGTVRKRWGLPFPPLTLASGRPDRLYVGEAGGGTIHVVDPSTGGEVSSFSASGSEVGLEASPDGTQLLVWTLGGSPLKMSLYDVATDSPGLLAADDHNLEAYAGDVEVDWARGIVYLTSGWGIERVSLPTLDRMERVRLDGSVVTLALSRDGTGLFGLDWDGILYAYDAPNASYVGYVRLASSRNWLEVAGDGRSLFAAYPFERLSFPARVETELWLPDRPLCFSPARVSVGVVHGIPRISFGMATISLDGRLLESSFTGVYYGGLYDELEGRIPDILPEGTHEVRARISWDGTTLDAVWNFTIDTSQGPPTCPYVSGGTPWGLLREKPTIIEVPVWRGDPSTEILWGEVRLNGRSLSSWLGGYEGDRLFALIPEGPLADGVYDVQASIGWRGGTSVTTWNFTLDTDYSIPRDPLTRFSHSSGFQILIPEGWTRQVDVPGEGGVTELIVAGPSLEGIQTVYLVDTEVDPTVRESRSYLLDQVQKSIDLIREERPGAFLDGNPQYRTISNHSSVVFILRDSQRPIVLKFVIVTSEAHQRFWILLMSVHEEWFLEANATFEAMLSSFDVSGSETRSASGDLLSWPILVITIASVGAGAALCVGVALYASRRSRTRPRSLAAGASTPASGGLVCGICGNPAAPPYRFCGKCGTALRGPGSSQRPPT